MRKFVALAVLALALAGGRRGPTASKGRPLSWPAATATAADAPGRSPGTRAAGPCGFFRVRAARAVDLSKVPHFRLESARAQFLIFAPQFAWRLMLLSASPSGKYSPVVFSIMH